MPTKRQIKTPSEDKSGLKTVTVGGIHYQVPKNLELPNEKTEFSSETKIQKNILDMKYAKVSKISQDLIFQIWIDNNLEHLVRDYKVRILNLLVENISEDKDIFVFKVQKIVFAYFEEKSENSSDYYLYNTYGGDLIKEIADRLIQELTPKTDEPSTEN